MRPFLQFLLNNLFNPNKTVVNKTWEHFQIGTVPILMKCMHSSQLYISKLRSISHPLSVKRELVCFAISLPDDFFPPHLC
jgi:membrane-anchored protein YejM (alkaline phosphatase superfamily)